MPVGWGLAASAAIGAIAGGKGHKASSDTTQAPIMTPEQEAKLKELLASLQVGGTSGSAYNAPLVANQNAIQGASLSALEQSALNAVNANGQNDVASSALKDIINAGPADVNASVVDPTMQDFIQRVLPAINGRFNGMSGFGSDKILQEGIASGNVATAIAKARADALQQQQANKMQAASLLPATQGGAIQNLLALQGAGGVAQAAAQRPLTANYEEFKRQQALKQQNLDNILQALGLKSVENITTVNPGSQSFLSSAAPSIGQAAATWALNKYGS